MKGLIAYLIRRYLPIVILAPFLLYSFLMYTPAGAVDHVHHPGIICFVEQYPPLWAMPFVSTFELEKPFPANYFSWVFDSSDTYAVLRTDPPGSVPDITSKWRRDVPGYLPVPDVTLEEFKLGYYRKWYSREGRDELVPKGISINLFGWGIQGSGLLTADLGESVAIAHGVPVHDMFGKGLSELFLTLASLLLALVFLYTLQRRGRPQAYRAITNPSAVSLVERHLYMTDLLQRGQGSR